MYSKILVPLDGSELSVCSVEHVKQVAAAGGVSEVILLRVIEPIASNDAAAWALAGYTVSDLVNKNKTLASGYLLQAAGELTKQGISARTAVIEGSAAEAILDYADQNKVDLIIISTHGRSGISRWAYGSVADKVVRNSTIPVLLISPPGCRTDK